MNKRTLAGLLAVNLGVNAYWWVENFWINLYWVREVDPSALNVAAMVAVSAVVGVATQVVVGALSDSSRSRFGRRRGFVLAGGALGALAMASFPLVRVARAAWDNLAAVLWLAVLLDAAITFFGDMTTPTRLALFKENTTTSNRGKYNTHVAVAAGAGALSLLVLYWTGFELGDAYFYLGALLLFVGAAACFALVDDPPVPDNPRRVGECLREVFRRKSYREHPNFYHVLLVIALASFGANVSGNFVYIYLENSLGLDQVAVGTVGAASSAFGVVLLGATWLSDSRGRKPVTAACLAAGSVGTAAMFFYRGTWLPGIVLALGVGGFTGAGQTVLDVWLQDSCPEEMVSSLLAYQMVARVVPMVPGSLLGGFLADAFASSPGLYGPEFFLAGALVVALAALGALFLEETSASRGFLVATGGGSA
ncbi:MAG: hypothetical protein Kow0069_14610 [Promethearchaeota archaeon]